MTFIHSTVAKIVAASVLFTSQVAAQAGPNTLAQYDPSNRTMSFNETFCILPIKKDLVETLTGYAPLDVPASILPNFPVDMHPMVVSAGYSNDIRMTVGNKIPLQIASLMEGSIVVPYTDVLKDGKTAIAVPLDNYIGGTNGQTAEAIVPAIASDVSPFEGTTLFPATFAPDTSAVQSLPNGLFSIEVKPYLLPNTVSGPGVYAEAFDMLYKITKDSPYTPHTFHALVNIPQLLNNGKCQRNTLYFNATFADPHMGVGNVTLYHQILETPPASIEGQYTNVYCYQANAEMVAATGESCAAAAAEFDPSSRN